VHGSPTQGRPFRDRQPKYASHSCLPAILEVGHATASSPLSMHCFRKPGACALEPPAPCCVWGGRAPIRLLSPRGGSATSCRLRSKFSDRCLTRMHPGGSTEHSHRWWRGTVMPAPPRGWSRGRLRFRSGRRSSQGKRREPSRCEHRMPSGGGERCWCREIHEACTDREASARIKHGRREDDQLANHVLVQGNNHTRETQAERAVPRCTRVLQLTSRTFTKPRSRATPGGGVSTPTEICYFQHLRGKRATRALREMILLAAAAARGCPAHLFR